MGPTRSSGYSIRLLRCGTLAGLLGLIGVGLTGCGGGSPAGRAVAASSTPAAATYQSKAFAVPFDITPPVWQPGAPTVEEANFVTWETGNGHAVRFLLPLSVYPPGGGSAIAPPIDYLSYLMGQTDHGAHFTNVSKTRVGSRAATLLTATVDKNLDGSLGCQKVGLAAGDCFGLQPDLSLRMAVLEVGYKPLLIWDRIDQTASDADKAVSVKAFEQMLQTFRFSTRPVQAPASTATATSPIDGVWAANWTYEELKASPLTGPGELNDENWGRYTLSFKKGQGKETVKNVKKTLSGTFKFHIDGDTVTFQRDNGEKFVMRWTITRNRLILTRDETIGGGPTPYVIKPWIRQS